MVSSCQDSGFPYVVINCPTKDYQLGSIFKDAQATFYDIPDLAEIVNINSNSPLGKTV
jgi:hypothetical protein